MDARKLILIIEDEQDLVMGLEDAFEFEGFRVASTPSGQEGVRLQEQLHPQLIILDLMLPDLNGYLVCEHIRERDPLVPVLILSARAEESDIIRGLESGADDYVTKPFSVAELLARVRTIFRRVELAEKRANPAIEVGQAVVDVNDHTAKLGNKTMPLSLYEAMIIQLLDERRGQPVSRDEILDKVWGLHATPTNRTVDNFILKLRRKLEKNPATPKHILTVYGQGYKLV